MSVMNLIDTPRLARVAVDVSHAHLDRFFDYEVPADLVDHVTVGVRVRVRFSGRVCDGFVVDMPADTDATKLAPILKVVSPQPVLKPEMVTFIRTVADYYCGVFSDVLRLAVPPRHATTEKAAPIERARPANYPEPTVLPGYPTGRGYLTALAQGTPARAAWTLATVATTPGNWAEGFAEAALATRRAGKQTLLLAPDHTDVAALAHACERILGRATFVQMTADVGPAARYRAFLAALRGDVDVVIGTRAAVFAPLDDLGLIALFDDGDDSWVEPHAPYFHAREVACLRAAQTGSGMLCASYHQTAEVAQLVQRGWLTELMLPRAQTRAIEPVVRAGVDSEFSLRRDPHAGQARLPQQAHATARAGLARGPVLVQVPRVGGRLSLVCADCRTPVKCPHCGGPVAQSDAAQLSCQVCARPMTSAWTCSECGGHRHRARQVGAARTSMELGKAFPHVSVLSSTGAQRLSDVPDKPCLVVATPGAEPAAPTGYAAALLLDGDVLLQRADLRAAEEALRRWSRAVALVRSAEDDGTVVVVADSSARAVQALVRRDPVGFALAELQDRQAAHFAPAAKVIEITGTAAAVAELMALAKLPDVAEALGPVPAPADAEQHRMLIRVPLVQRNTAIAAVKAACAVRSAKKSGTGALRVRVDPAIVG